MQDNQVIPPVNNDFSFPAEVKYLDAGAPPSGLDSVIGNFQDPQLEVLENFNLMDLVQMFIVYAFIIAAAMSAVFIFMGGMSFILSGGDDEKIKRAVNTIRYSIIGLVVTILSFTVVTIVGRMFGLNFMDYLSYGKIKNSINQLISTGDRPTSSFDIQR